MAIINTLITATDKTKQGLDSASKGFKRWGKTVSDSANDAQESLDGFEGSYENIKNQDSIIYHQSLTHSKALKQV